MTVKEIVRLAAIYLNKDNVVKYLDGEENNDALHAVNALTVCANLIINEIATSYISMTFRDVIRVENGKINLLYLTYTPLEVLGVYDSLGNPLQYSEGKDVVKVSDNAREIEYRYSPPNYGLTETICFSKTDVSLRLLAYGTVSEYCLIERAFDESVTWRNRFNDSLSAITLPSSKTMRARSFI